MAHTLRVLFRRDPGRDRNNEQTQYEGYEVLQARGLLPDPWQRDLLLSSERQVLLNCSRQSGKSTVVSD